MMRVLGGLLVLVLTFAPSAASAQVSVWLQKGVSGVGASVGVSHTDGDTGVQFEGGYSFEGFLDLGLTLGRHDLSTDATPDLIGYEVQPTIEYHPLKQTKEMPISLSVGTAYGRSFIVSDQLSANDISASAWNFTLASFVYRFIRINERVGVIPTFGAGWVYSSLTLSRFGDDMTVSDDGLRVLIGANLAVLDHANHIWGIAPSLSFGHGSTAFGISVNFVAPLVH
jgi:Outer membrane protein beta-barrel domain